MSAEMDFGNRIARVDGTSSRYTNRYHKFPNTISRMRLLNRITKSTKPVDMTNS